VTEAEWLACADPFRMLRLLHPRSVSARQYRLFGAACCRRAWLVRTDTRCRDAAAALERFADGPGEGADRTALAEVWGVERPANGTSGGQVSQDLAIRCIYAAAQPPNAWWTAHWTAEAWLECAGAEGDAARGREAAVVAHLLRDIIANPFGPSPPLPTAVLAWNDRLVPRLAQTIYDDRKMPEGTLDTGRLAILADALLDAGCEDEELLAHLRSVGPHVRGCWAVDLILGKG
jgi:hypothetical protein